MGTKKRLQIIKKGTFNGKIVSIIIDSGVEGDYISHKIQCRDHIKMQEKKDLYTVTTVDGSTIGK